MLQSNFLLTAANLAINVSTGAGHLLIISGLPDINYLTAKSQGLIASKVETPQVWKALSAAATAKEYEFQITQFCRQTDSTRVWDVYYLSTSADTDTTIGANIKAIIDNYVAKSGLNVVTTFASGTLVSTGLIIKGGAGDPFVTITNVTNMTVTNPQLLLSNSRTIASVTAANPTVLTASGAHGLSVGQFVTITSADDTKLASGTYRVHTVPLATTFTLDTGDGVTTLAASATTTATFFPVAQASMGTFTDIGNIVGAATTNPATAGHTYSTVVFYQVSSGAAVNANPTKTEGKILAWADEADANYATWAAALVAELNTLDIT